MLIGLLSLLLPLDVVQAGIRIDDVLNCSECLETDADGDVICGTDEVDDAIASCVNVNACAITADDVSCVGCVDPTDLNVVAAPGDGECLTYEAITTNFEWLPCGGAEVNNLEDVCTGILASEVPVGDALGGTATYTALPDCDTAGDALNYDTGLRVFSCATGYIDCYGVPACEDDPQVGAVTDDRVCQGDGTKVECDLTMDAAGDCAVGAVCMGGHEHSSYLTTVDISDDTNLAAGTNITLVGDTLNVDDSFILNTGDVGTGVYDFGGATSFEIPNAADVSGNTGEGMISWDSDDDKLYMGTGAAVVEIGAGGGGDAWGDLVDADIVPDVDSARDLGGTLKYFAELYVDNAAVGDTSTLVPERTINTARTSQITSDFSYGIYDILTVNPLANSTGSFTALGGYVVFNNTYLNGAIAYGLDFMPFFSGTSGHTGLTTYGIRTAAAGGSFSGGTVGTGYGLHVTGWNNLVSTAINATTLYGIYVADSGAVGGGSITTLYQMFVAKPTVAGTNYQMVLDGTGAGSGIWFGGTGGIRMNAASTSELEIDKQFTSSYATDLGWAVVAGANTACNTTCVHACVFGYDDANDTIVGCTDATADKCVCAGGT